MDETYYTIPEVAERFKVTKAAVYKWMRAGLLPFVIIGKDRRITGTALKEFVKPGQLEDIKSLESAEGNSQPLTLPRMALA